MCGAMEAGIVWVDNGRGAGFRYFTQYREKIKRRPKKKVIEVVLRGRKIEVNESDIRRYPGEERMEG